MKIAPKTLAISSNPRHNILYVRVHNNIYTPSETLATIAYFQAIPHPADFTQISRAEGNAQLSLYCTAQVKNHSQSLCHVNFYDFICTIE